MTSDDNKDALRAIDEASRHGCGTCQRRDEDLRWFVLLVRQGLKLIVAGIESRYGLRERDDRRIA